MKFKIIFSLIFVIFLINLVSAAVWNSSYETNLTNHFPMESNLLDTINSESFSQVIGTSVFNLSAGINNKGVFIDENNKIIFTGTTSLGHSVQSINFWINNVGTTAGKVFARFGDTSTGYIQEDGGKYHWFTFCGNAQGTASVTEGKHMITVKKNATNTYCYVDGVLDSAGTPAFNFTMIAFPWQSANAGDKEYVDEILNYPGRNLNDFEISELYNSGNGIFPVSASSLTVSLITPLNNSASSNTYIIFNASVTPTGLNLTNATFYLWNSSSYEVNKTTNVLTGNVINYTRFNVTNFDVGRRYYWNVKGCIGNATFTNCSFASSNYTFTSSAFAELNTTFNNSVIETTTQSLRLNISANPSITSAVAYIWYNGTRYSSNLSNGASGFYSAGNTLDIPLQESIGNKTFFWEWIFILNDATSISQNSTTYSHEVNRTWLVACNSTFPTTYVNFTARSAMNPFPILNATFKSAWQYWFGRGNIKRNYSYEEISGNKYNWTFCGSPASLNFSANANIEFDSGGYAQNFYYIQNATISNQSSNINLYLLNDTEATVTELKTQDASQNPIGNVIIQIQLYDVGTDTYYTVAMAKTSSAGSDIVYLNWYSSLYKFILIQNGEVVKIEEPQKISATPKIFTISDEIIYSFEKFRDFIYTLTYNNATQNFVLTFTKPSGLVDQGCLRVTKRTSYNDTEICLTCETSTSATVYCNIGSSGNGTYIATFYATGSWYLLDWITETIGETFSETIYNLLGNDDATAYAFLFSGIVTAMFFISPIFAIIGLILGILGGAALGFTILNYSEFLGIAIAGAVIAWFVRR